MASAQVPGTIEVSLEPAELPIRPGELASGHIRVRNRGPSPQSCRLNVVGEVADWAWLVPQEFVVQGAGEEEVRLCVRLPPPPEPAPGPLPFSVEVHVDPGASPQVASGQLDVAPVAEVSALLGGALRAEPTHPLTVQNKGNVQVHVDLSVTGEGRGASVEPTSFDLRPGELGTARVTVHPRSRLGRRQETTFSVNVRPDAGEPVTIEGRA